jgi:DNA polymerase-3 subunit epsilon
MKNAPLTYFEAILPNPSAVLYAVVDIETTGSRPGDDRITEIAILVHDGEQVIDSYTTLINPERAIPSRFRSLPASPTRWCATPPCFPEVARRIVEMTDGKVFVAHNVRFDYSFLKPSSAAWATTTSARPSAPYA